MRDWRAMVGRRRDKTQGPDGPRYIITLVHGTFAPNAEWTQPGSKLRQILERCLGGPENVRFEVFTWRGLLGLKFNNGHRYRLSAGSRLAATLSHAITQYPEAKHFIIAHSHGGNVAFYALRAGQLSRRIAGVICIATPFITCQPRDGSSTTRFYPIILWTIFAFAALLPITIIGIVPAAKVLTFLTSKFPSMAEPMIWIWAGGISVGLYLLCAKLPTKLIYDWMIPWLEEWVPRKQQGIVARLSLPLLPDQPTLCIRAAGDEATRHLSMVKGAGDLPYGVWRGGLYMISSC